MSVDYRRLAFRVEGHEVGGRSNLTRRVVFPGCDVLQEAVHQCTARPGYVWAARSCGGERATYCINGVVVQAIEVFGCSQPVEIQVGFVPDLKVPTFHLGLPITLDAVAGAFIEPLTPLRVGAAGR